VLAWKASLDGERIPFSATRPPETLDGTVAGSHERVAIERTVSNPKQIMRRLSDSASKCIVARWP
jgi:hypothetical protein